MRALLVAAVALVACDYPIQVEPGMLLCSSDDGPAQKAGLCPRGYFCENGYCYPPDMTPGDTLPAPTDALPDDAAPDMSLAPTDAGSN